MSVMLPDRQTAVNPKFALGAKASGIAICDNLGMRGKSKRSSSSATPGSPERRASPYSYLAEWREFRSYSQQAAGELIEHNHTHLSKIERGKAPYMQKHLEKLAELYDTTPAELLGRNPFDPSNIWALAHRLTHLDEEKRGMVVRFLDAIDPPAE